jgi:[glutamine synthetase] adenylyltransferase / [glutamine synthetase]-adenylyl-L-tyrosine phosphorylase
MDRSEVERAVFAKCGNPARMAGLWGDIVNLATKVRPGGAAEMDELLLRNLHPLPNPSRALVHLDRFLESSFSASSILQEFLDSPKFLETFFRIVCTSNFLADLLVRDPQLFRFLASSNIIHESKNGEEYLQAAREACAVFEDPEKQIHALRRFHKRELLYLATADILGHRTLESVTRALSDIADVVLQITLEYAIGKYEKQSGQTLDVPFCIIALGKLGGIELNYSSDIDLMVIYAEDKQLTDQQTMFDAAAKVVELLMGTLTKKTSEGFFYRTDLRLRPDGGVGAPAHSLQTAMTYYETRGTLWERQMLLKARVAAGNASLGAAFLEGLKPYLFPRTAALAPRRILDDVRRRLELRPVAAENIKHMQGGIRYIEFSLQALQVIHAARDTTLRKPASLDAMAALEAARLLTEEESAELRLAYEFYRRLEHLLQLELFEQTHSLPKDDGELEELAWKMNSGSWSQLYERIDRHKQSVLKIFYNIFEPRTMEREPPSLISAEQYSMNALGFRDTVGMQKTLRMFIQGRSQRPHPVRLQHKIGGLIGTLLAQVSREQDPDQCLLSLEFALNTSSSPESVISYLAEEDARKFLLRLASLAPSHYRAITPFPEVYDAVFGGWEPNPDDQSTMQVVQYIYQTRNLGGYLLGLKPFEEYLLHESRIADMCVEQIFNTTLKESEVPFIVVAFGKYGGEELTMDSDLDIVLVHDSTGDPDQEKIIQVAQQFEQKLRELSLYNIDTRVRPEGSKGLASISIQAYKEYFRGRASAWERQALLRARVAVGNDELGKQYAAFVQQELAGMPVDHVYLDGLVVLRRKSEPVLRAGKKQVDIKLSPGGLMDTEYALQAALLYLGSAFGNDVPSNTFAAFDLISEAMPKLEYRLLRLKRNYHFQRKLQLAFRLLFDRSSNLLPSSSGQLLQLALSLSYTSPDELKLALADAQKETREDMLKVIEHLRGLV